MPPKILFPREEIENAAFKLFASGGIRNVSVRKIASLLGSSTAPIYSNFSSMDEINKVLTEKALGLLLNYTGRKYTEDPFLNIGVGLLIFARENKVLYRSLFLESNRFQEVFDRLNEENLVRMKQDESLSVFNEDELRSILDKMTFFTLGLAAHLCAGYLKDTSDEWFIKTLYDMGDDVLRATAHKKGKPGCTTPEGGHSRETHHHR
ncbi:MAG TPA: helix-turn-helix domain-containing protein [Thermoclostridium caenicola]|nr:helix-turn-helix domain-containing protein [Thermoclostridium caenicola]